MALCLPRVQIKSAMSLMLKDIPGYRIRDASFWTLAYRGLVHPLESNGPSDIYERLLPYLNTRPLLSNIPASMAQEVRERG
ncbi:unnamed protein product [Discosporangium mesarthrocarpum]